MNKDLENKITGALFDFVSSLTTGEEITLGGNHICKPVLDRLQEWAEKRNLNLDEADVLHWWNDLGI